MRVTLQINGQAVEAEVLERSGNRVRLSLGGKEYHIAGQRLSDGSVQIDSEMAPGIWRRTRGAVLPVRGGALVQLGELDFKVMHEAAAQGAESQAAGALSPAAPMPGVVRKILVKEGQRVKAGDAVAVLEAMKLQLTLSAGGDAVVEAILAQEGQMVPEGALLVKLKAQA